MFEDELNIKNKITFKNTKIVTNLFKYVNAIKTSVKLEKSNYDKKNRNKDTIKLKND
jgi:hypothetical protein